MGNVSGNAPKFPPAAAPSPALCWQPDDLTWLEMCLECRASVPQGGESWACGLGPEIYNYSVQLC